ncbi:MAG TPA: SIR2 family protein [Saprospiraceae bacterium]|nr:SIR2 family protein [Saprospiraceae bacterium]
MNGGERKQSTVFLGAGASKAFGLPLTKEIFPLLIQKLENNTLFRGNMKEIELLRHFLNSLLPGLDLIQEKEYPLITDILSLLDHSIAEGFLLTGGDSLYRYEQYRYLFEKAILQILELKQDEANEYLKLFVEWIVEQLPHQMITIISTNYENVFEQMLYDQLKAKGRELESSIDFGFDWRDPGFNRLHMRPSDPDVSIYKLHGSSNWLKCDLCNHIYINTSGNIYQLAYEKENFDLNTCECGHRPLSALIIAPSLSRKILDTNLPHIWHNAQERLRTSEEWIIIGYSMPPEDLNIKSMFIRALHARSKPPHISIVQKGEVSRPAYQSIMGDIHYHAEGLEGYVNAHRELQK